MITVTDDELTSLRELGIDLSKILERLRLKGAKKSPRKATIKDMNSRERQQYFAKKYQ